MHTGDCIRYNFTTRNENTCVPQVTCYCNEYSNNNDIVSRNNNVKHAPRIVHVFLFLITVSPKSCTRVSHESRIPTVAVSLQKEEVLGWITLS